MSNEQPREQPNVVEEVKALLADNQLYHDAVQIDSFILNANGGTVWGTLKQCLRELDKRWRGIKELALSEKELQLDIEELEAAVDPDVTDETKGCIEYRRNVIALTRKRMAMDGLERTVADTKREFNHFLQRAKQLKAMVGEVTPERRQELDVAYWIERCKTNAAEDYLSAGRVSKGTINMLNSLPATMRGEIATAITEADGSGNPKVIAWYETRKHALEGAALPTPSTDVEMGLLE